MQLTALLDAMSPTDPSIVGRESAFPCQENDMNLWFAELPAELELAKSHCAICPVQAQCLAGALERREPWGVWGGEIFEAGRVLPRKRPRGRPRKDDPFRALEQLSGAA